MAPPSSSRRRALRPSFVTTVAAAAAVLAGCASAVDPGGDGGPMNEQCPASRPVRGTPCEHDGLACTWGSCTTNDNGGAYCDPRTHQWISSAGGCNPPSLECPTTEPTNGESCPIASNRVCNYGSCYGSPTAAATCGNDLRWHVQVSSCNPPALAMCPVNTPVNGAPCTPTEPADCHYTPCGPDWWETHAQCNPSSNTWEVATIACNPPRVDAGPPDDVSVDDASVDDAFVDDASLPEDAGGTGGPDAG